MLSPEQATLPFGLARYMKEAIISDFSGFWKIKTCLKLLIEAWQSQENDLLNYAFHHTFLLAIPAKVVSTCSLFLIPCRTHAPVEIQGLILLIKAPFQGLAWLIELSHYWWSKYVNGTGKRRWGFNTKWINSGYSQRQLFQINCVGGLPTWKVFHL